ncbi:LOW QUALITY PROTEIN: uncharacterized protein LOC128800027 [Vidua chalybeata]|uniref:LOW QUALITY PROTEIN: uncharacterized protein LOC128800027 n=1 Tax=Vidua chalybeata TaxID=81927 RepID=UPI0023A90B1F|nr:LOW QUALITY PROTEIN: uncharacterized protein LOC128800027 [Vidua chalybeata]
MRRCRGAGLAALAALLLVPSGRAQVQQEPLLKTTEDIGINISCSHPKIQTNDWIQWYRQLPSRAPEFLALTARGSKDVPAIAGQLRVSADRRWSALWLGRPRRGDAAVYYCALGARAEEPGLRPGTNRRGRGRPGPAGGAAARPAGPRAAPQLLPLPRARTHRPRTAPHGPAHASQPACSLRSHTRHTQPGLPSLPSPPPPHTKLLPPAPLPAPLALRPRLLLLSACFAKQRDAPGEHLAWELTKQLHPQTHRG